MNTAHKYNMSSTTLVNASHKICNETLVMWSAWIGFCIHLLACTFPVYHTTLETVYPSIVYRYFLTYALFS